MTPTKKREVFPLSLRMSDPFEAMLYECLKQLPSPGGKHFLVRAARLFCRSARTQTEMFRIMRAFVEDVQPVALQALPTVTLADAAGPSRNLVPVVPRAAPPQDDLAL